LPTPDNDVLELDWETSTPDARQLVIVSHGLEGSTAGGYVRGMVKKFARNGWHALAWNYRGCGEMNRLPRFYHSGATDDLHTVLQHAISLGQYDKIALVGFSLGGNLTLKYVGELGENLPPCLHSAVAFSAPVHLSSCCKQIDQFRNKIYAERFKITLKSKVRRKARLMPDAIDVRHLPKVRRLQDFDEYYTAPLHGFAGAEEYYERCSSLYFLDTIALPTLIVNAKNDPMLSPACFPYEKVKNHPFVFLETPATGGHCGFSYKTEGFYWSEHRAFEWATAKTR
jgi:predicted alpha/beta-fold hydrolase